MNYYFSVKMKESDQVTFLDFRLYESNEGKEAKNDYDHDFLRRLIDNSLINTFGIIDASKIQYELILKSHSIDFQIKTTKK